MPFAAARQLSSTVAGIRAFPAVAEIVATRLQSATAANTIGRESTATPAIAAVIAQAHTTSLPIRTRSRGRRSTIDAAMPPPTIGGTRRIAIRSATSATDDVDR